MTAAMLEVDDMLDLFWWTPCPPGKKIGLWREACAEVAELCGDDITPLHYEDLKRLVRQVTPTGGQSAKALFDLSAQTDGLVRQAMRIGSFPYGQRCIQCLIEIDGDRLCLRCDNR